MVTFRHQGYQLWESKVLGFLSNIKNDFIILNKEGIKFITLSDTNLKKTYKKAGQEKIMIHTLSSMNFLKIEDENMISFEDLDDNTVMLDI